MHDFESKINERAKTRFVYCTGLVDFMLLLEGTCFYGPESSGTIADNDTRALRRSTILEMAAPPMYSKEMRKTNKEDLQKALKVTANVLHKELFTWICRISSLSYFFNFLKVAI